MEKIKHSLPIVLAFVLSMGWSMLPVRAAEQTIHEPSQEKLVQTIESVVASDLHIGDEEIEAILWAIEQGWVDEGIVANPHVLAAMEENNKPVTKPVVTGWTGPVLSKEAGINYGPSGKESYYNLNMDLVVQNMRALGFTGEYWVRNDGVKMFGNYIICAANFAVHPRGSLVESSLGTCIVCDTGSFAVHNPHMLDIAVTW